MHLAIEFDERSPRLEMRMLGGLVHGHDGHGAGVGPLEQSAPLVAGLGLEYHLELFLQIRPFAPVVLIRELRVVDAGTLQQFGIELGFYGAERKML